MRWLDHKRRIAVTGLAGSGKTVFLLSLLQHMEYFRHDRFPIVGGDDAAISEFREIKNNGKFAAFPRSRLRAGLMARQDINWPAKTCDIYQYRCSFNYNQLGLTTRMYNTFRNLVKSASLMSERVEWDILDFPGERLSDSLAAKHQDFAEWSDELLEQFETSEHLQGEMQEYLDLLQKGGSPVDATIIAVYKKCLTRIVHKKYQLITPSTFMLDKDGARIFSAEDLENSGIDRVSGLAGAEFSPLPAEFRNAEPLVAARFADNYGKYREEVVLPLFNAINSCDTLLVLLDIPNILSGGVGRLNDTKHLLETLALSITPSNWFFTNVDKAAFIASKSDMVHDDDLDRLWALTEELMQDFLRRQTRLSRECEAFTVSAWVSSKSTTLKDGSHALQAMPARGFTGQMPEEPPTFRVPPLPAEWPEDDWESTGYPRLMPPRLANKSSVPRQRNLEKIFDFIMRGKK